MPGPLRPSPDWLGHYRDRTVVVTGAGGFLGGCLVNRLAATPCRIVRVARSTLVPLALPHAATVVDVVGDVRHEATWTRGVAGADVIVHFAAQTSVAVATENPARDLDANVAPIRILLAACRHLRPAPVILFAGTVTQTGVPSQTPVNEDTPDDPVSIYDQHKLMAEQELKRAVSAGTARGATLRLANVYGPGSPGRSKDREVLNRMIRAALRGEPLTVFGAGDYLRDYLFVDDAVDAFLMAGAKADCLNGRHYVIGSGIGTTIRDAFELIAARAEAATGRPTLVITAEAQPLSRLEQRHFVADVSRFAADTGWRPTCKLSDGIDRTIEAYQCE